MEQGPSRRPRQVSRVISGAMFTGAALFWILAVLLVRAGVAQVPAAGLVPHPLALLIGVVLGLAAAVGGAIARANVLKAVESARHEGWPAESTPRIMGWLTIGWALATGPALFVATSFLMFGDAGILWVAGPLCVLGMGLTAPRADWFPPER